MACKENDKVKRAVENYEVLTGDEEVKRLAEIRLMSKLEEKSALDCAREEGLEQGLKRGKKEIAQKLKKQKMLQVKNRLHSAFSVRCTGY